ncbi:hypothetical protein FPHYL_8452 [Fusarium phyllophilum]|uniref:Uncharacterized protein n=1 Tax=Fusarium phyllophilum TaxID=47803 RepID=A0A8H5JGJ8_9HYPO|nr:hypothetical protein FPHYL_8452 [Fusarium phyllophilum]
MRRVLGPKAHNKWQNISMMIGWCLHVAETDRSVSIPRPWTAADAELSVRLGVWGVPAFVRLALLGTPWAEGPSHSELRPKWQKDEERILGKANGLGKVEDFWYGQQDDLSQAGAFNSVGSSIDTQYWSTENPVQAEVFRSVGSNTEVPYRSIEAPYRIQENALGPLGMTHLSGGLVDFDSLPQEERSRRAGTNRKRPCETEEDTLEEIHGLGYDNFGNRERSKRIRGKGSRSASNSTKELYARMEKLCEKEEITSEDIDGLGWYGTEDREQSNRNQTDKLYTSIKKKDEMEDDDLDSDAWETSESTVEG